MDNGALRALFIPYPSELLEACPIPFLGERSQERRAALLGMGDGLIYSGMAETMMLTLVVHLRNTSLGTYLSLEMLHQLRTLAEKCGFHIAKLRSFDRPLEVANFRLSELAV